MPVSALARLGRRPDLLLGTIRLVNGVVALAAPTMASRRLGLDPEANPAAIYPLRMFGVRTIVLGIGLLTGPEQSRRERMRVGVAIHASDTAAAALGGLRGHLPPRVAVTLTGVSALNTALAILGSRRPLRRSWLERLRRPG